MIPRRLGEPPEWIPRSFVWQFRGVEHETKIPDKYRLSLAPALAYIAGFIEGANAASIS